MGGYLEQTASDGKLNVLLPTMPNHTPPVRLQHWILGPRVDSQPPWTGPPYTPTGKEHAWTDPMVDTCSGAALIQHQGWGSLEALLFRDKGQGYSYLEHWFLQFGDPQPVWVDRMVEFQDPSQDLRMIGDTPALILSTVAGITYFEALVPIRNTGLKHWFSAVDRQTGTPGTWVPGYQGQVIVQDAHGVALIQSTVGNLEALVHVGNDIQHWSRHTTGPVTRWVQGNGGNPIIKGVDAARRPALIQSNWGTFEALVSVQNGLQHWWCDTSK
ncbi:MAG: hypothetical protein WA364_30175, partial [Candidatus Nitrosopolaris sp.]